MGVFKLWQLLLTIAQPLQINELSGKILAIDASIWIVKIDSLYNSNSQKLKSILSKIMILKRNNILPIFVFDGVAPVLKRKTLQSRNRKRLIADELQAKKKSEIQIMRLIEGGQSSRLSEKSKKVKKNEEELSELNKTLKNLNEFREDCNQQINNQLLQKINMQSQILNTKYKLMLDLTPQFTQYQFYIPYEEYQLNDLQRKIEYLDQLEQYRWKHIKKERRQKSRDSMTEQEKLMQDLEVIEKRSIIREMQDNLFRKMMEKHVKTENGLQIVETIYNGRKVIQKRKIKTESSSGFGIGIRKGKMKNDVGHFNFNEGKQVSSDQAEQDQFIAEFCSQTAPKQFNKQKIQLKLPHQTQKQPVKTQRQIHQKDRQIKDSSEQLPQNYIPFKTFRQSQQQDEQPQNYVNKKQLHDKFISNEVDKELLNKDNLPEFNLPEHLQYVNYSNDNLQLQNLFTILGIPFIVAPSQAEAQCAALERMGIVDGVVTQDSDTFLFGGKHIYRGVFQNNIRYYDYHKIQDKLKLNRQKLIIFALLLGSDYTSGVKGIGLVNAMQILKVFTTFDKLQKFKKWAQHPDVLLPQEQTTSQVMKNAKEDQKQFYQLHRKYKNYWYIDQSFTSKNVRSAYLQPQIIKEEQVIKMKQQGRFQQKECKVAILQKLLREKLELESKQFDHYMKLLTFKFQGKRQNTLHNYFQNQQMARIKSKRLQKSIDKTQL